MSKRLIENTLVLSIVQLVNYIAPLFALTYLTNKLGMDLFGVLAFSQGIIALSFVLIDFGFELSATAKVSAKRGRRNIISKILSSITLIKLVIFIFVAIFISFYGFNTVKYKEYSIIFILSLLPLFGQSFLPTWLFQGIERMRLVALILVLSKVIFIISITLYINEPNDYYLVPVLNGFANLLALALSMIIIFKMGFKFYWPRLREIRYCINFTKYFFYSRIAVASYVSAAPVVLGIFSTPASVAIYSIAEQLYRAMQAAFSPVISAAYPYMAKEKDVILMFKVGIFCALLALLGSITGYLITPLLINLFFDQSWNESIPILNIFFIAIVIHVCAVILGYPFAVAVGKLSVANTSVILGAIFYIIVLIIVIKFNYISPISLAIIMVFSELIVLIYRGVILIPAGIKQYMQTERAR